MKGVRGVGGLRGATGATRGDGTEGGEEGKGGERGEEERGGGEILADGWMDRPIKGSTRGPRGPKKRSLPPKVVSYWYLHPKEMFVRLGFCLSI